MKFAERGFILMCLIGYYLAVWQKPQDMSVLFVAAALLSICYILGMPLLLMDVPVKIIFRKETLKNFKIHFWISGSLFGILSAYTVFSVIYYSLGQMTLIALLENCGLGLLIFGFLSGLRKRIDGLFYQKMFRRVGMLAGSIVVALLMHFVRNGKL